MTSEELNTALYQKMFEEQDDFRKGLLAQAPEEILKQAYEYTVREDILISLENNDLTDEQATALLKSPSPLGDIFSEFESRETGYMEAVLDCVTDKANAVIQMEAAERQALLNTPVYKYPAAYARGNNELEQYRASHKANVACKNAIETAIRDNYRDNCLGKEAVKQVADQFGYERMFYVLANTAHQKDFDGRISRDNKDWAKTIPVFEDKDYFGDDRRSEFEVDSCNPGLTDIFINQARREYLLTQPLSKEDIQSEAARLLRHLQSEREPNSPSGTHYMAQLSPDFLIRASTKDQDRLFALLPFKSLSFSTLKDRKGIFAFIQKDENRDQPLRECKPSVRKNCKKHTPSQSRLPHPRAKKWSCNMANRNRKIQLKFRVTPQEREMVEQKMAQLGTKNMAAYLRKIAIDGYAVRLELPELKEMVSLLRRSSNNLNQLTKRVHEMGRVYDTDLEDIVQNQERLWQAANNILAVLAKIE